MLYSNLGGACFRRFIILFFFFGFDWCFWCISLYICFMKYLFDFAIEFRIALISTTTNRMNQIEVTLINPSV